MVSQEVLVDQHRKLASKNSDANQGPAPRETTGKEVFMIGVDLGILGVDLAWIVWDRERKAEKSPREIRASFWNKIRAIFLVEIRPRTISYLPMFEKADEPLYMTHHKHVASQRSMIRQASSATPAEHGPLSILEVSKPRRGFESALPSQKHFCF